MKAVAWTAIDRGLVAFFLAAVVLLSSGTSTKETEADIPHAGLNLSISVGTQCDSDAGSPRCTVGAGQSFTVDFNVTSIPPGFTYSGYDSALQYSEVTVDANSLVQQGAGVWPDCGFPASSFDTAGLVLAGCARGVGAQPSSYTGVINHIDFRCPSTPTSAAIVTLLSAPNIIAPNTDVLDEQVVTHGEFANENLTVTCGTSTTGVTGDVNCDGTANVVDARLALQYIAGLLSALPCQSQADVNHDGSFNSIDVELVLQFAAGRLPHL